MRAPALLAFLPAALGAIAQIRLPHWPIADLLDTQASVADVVPDAKVEAPLQLSSVAGNEFTVLTSPLYPDHRVRIKSTDGWCDPHARSYSGYIDAGYGKELFFYFFESRDKPDKDPIVMWINGGPGGSSAMGLFMELGPCTINDNPKSANDTKPNPHSWNNHANIFFLDEPIGVGYSRARHGQTVGTTEEAAADVAAFVAIFFQQFKEFEGRAFHMSGESYGGRYLPVFASAVYDANDHLIQSGHAPVNIQSVLIGNGITDWYATTESYFPFACNRHPDLNRSVLSIGACVEMAEALPRCDKLARRGCQETKDWTTCTIAMNYCSEVFGSAWVTGGFNPYDVSKPCTPDEYMSSLCYPDSVKMGEYLNLPDVRARLGVAKDAPAWQSISWDVNTAFRLNLDNQTPTWLYVTQLLERGVRVLNYVGTLDFVCNYVGNADWMERLEWSGKDEYNAAKQRDWHVDGKVAGWTKSAGDLTFATIYGAGHMVPMDKPKQSAAMFEAWIKGDPLPK